MIMPTEKLAAVRVNGDDLKCLQPVLRKWQTLVEEYCDEYQAECEAPYWCGERANVSFFAGAVWRCQGKALQEYSSTKDDEEASKEEEYKGRTDLWIAIKKKSFVIEAKLVEPDLASSDKQIKQAVQEALDSARNEAAGNRDKADHKLGFVFITPHAKTRRSIGQRLERLLCVIRDQIDYGAMAHSFPDAAANLRDEKGYYNPGVVLLVGRAL